MGQRPLFLLIAGVVLAIVAVFLVQGYVDRAIRQQQPAQTAAPGPAVAQTRVVVAATPLFFGSHVRPEHLKVVDWPASAVPPGSFQSVEALLEGDDQRVALRAIEMNEPVLASKVSGRGGRLSMSGLIESNMRAAAIRVNDIVGVGGFVLPGDRVDVLLTRMIGQNQDQITDVILQNVRVVGIDQQANEAMDKPAVARSVTLEVTTRDAQKLALAQQVGSLALALRNLGNTEADRVARISIQDLVSTGPSAPPVQKAAAKSAPVRAWVPTTAKVKVVRGFASTDYTVKKQKADDAKTPVAGSKPATAPATMTTDGLTGDAADPLAADAPAGGGV